MQCAGIRDLRPSRDMNPGTISSLLIAVHSRLDQLDGDSPAGHGHAERVGGFLAGLDFADNISLIAILAMLVWLF